MQLILITGLSGSGKSVALAVMEDAGFYCVDNLPVNMVGALVETLRNAGTGRVALTIDVRTGEAITGLPDLVTRLREDGIEVRGLGVLNIRTIFGEAALRPRKNVKIVVHLEKPSGSDPTFLDRLPLKPGSELLMEVEIRKVTIPVAAGRNLAVLTEAAVRNHVLQMRGIDSTREFVERQAQAMHNRDD